MSMEFRYNNRKNPYLFRDNLFLRVLLEEVELPDVRLHAGGQARV